MTYKLQGYMYKNCKIYKRIWGFLYKCIDKGPHGVDVGVRKINQLCRIFDEETDYSTLILLPINNEICGKFLTNFKEPSTHFLNDPLPATIKPYKGYLNIQWDNGHSCVIDASRINIYRKLCKTECDHLKTSPP